MKGRIHGNFCHFFQGKICIQIIINVCYCFNNSFFVFLHLKILIGKGIKIHPFSFVRYCCFRKKGLKS